MTCTEFQRVLPYLMETGGNAEAEAHLKSCAVCADLVADLKYIADVAKLLVPMEEPSPGVWNRIEQSLTREGLVRPAGARGRLLGPQQWGALPWAAALAALLLVVVGLVFYSRSGGPRQEQQTSAVSGPTLINTSAASGYVSQDDLQILSSLAENAPALRDSYEESMRRVNAYISDAERSLQQDPNDQEAHEFLLKAYEQKALLYELAMSRSLR